MREKRLEETMGLPRGSTVSFAGFEKKPSTMTPEEEAVYRLRKIILVLENGGKLLSIKDTLIAGNIRGIEVTYDDKGGKLDMPGESLVEHEAG